MFGFGKKDKFCPICSMNATDSTFKQFGKHFCSREHLDVYVQAEKERQERYAKEQSMGHGQHRGG